MTDKQTVEQSIQKYLKGKDWTWGGTTEDKVHELTGHKASTVSRKLRRLVALGILDVRYVQVEGKGPEVTQYRLKPKDYQLNIFQCLKQGTA
jgi:predicted transcriptional regulator